MMTDAIDADRRARAALQVFAIHADFEARVCRAEAAMAARAGRGERGRELRRQAARWLARAEAAREGRWLAFAGDDQAEPLRRCRHIRTEAANAGRLRAAAG